MVSNGSRVANCFSDLHPVLHFGFACSTRLMCLLLFATTVASHSCVGKAKHLGALENSARAKSELAKLEADLNDTYAQRDHLRRKVQAQQALIANLENDRQQVVTRQHESTQLLSDQLRERDRQDRKLRRALDSLTAVNTELRAPQLSLSARLSSIESRLNSVIAPVPSNQRSILRQADHVELLLSENLLFKNRSDKLSAYGDALLSQLASALGGRHDLSIEVIALPVAASIGSSKAWAEAAARATAIAHNLVDIHGLAPQIVTASAQVGHLETVEEAPSERQASYVRLRVKPR